MKLFLKSLLLVLAATSSVSAACINDELRFEGGWRNDEYSHTIDTVYASGVTETNDFSVSSVDLGTFGVRGRFFVPQWDDCGCFDMSLLDNFYVQGFANWGWSGRAKYHHDVALAVGDGVVDVDNTGNLSYVNTSDFQIGLGYFIDLGCWFNDCSCLNLSDWGLGVAGGYQWDRQKFKVSSATLVVDDIFVGDNPLEEGLKVYQRWQGPWVGAQLFYNACGWSFDVAYEYHFCLHTNGHYNFTDLAAIFGAVDYSWRGHDGHSNVVYVNGYYELCQGWDLGLGFKYQDWHATRQRTSFDPDVFLVDSSSGDYKVCSYSLYGSLGYSF